MQLISDDEQLFEQLENEDLPTSIYEKRVVELKHQINISRQLKEHGCGEYNLVPNDEAILKLTTSLDKVVLHFRHPDFQKCLELDQHLKAMAKKFPDVKFGHCNVLECPFIVEKFNIKILPHLVIFHKGIAKKHFIGFEEFGVHNVEEKHVAYEVMQIFNKN